MAEDNVGEVRNIIVEPTTVDSPTQRSKERLAFRQATIADTDAAFRDTSTTGKPRKQRTIASEKRSQVTISDTLPEHAQKVKGKAPAEPKEESTEEKRSVGRPRKTTGKTFPTLTESSDSAKLLLSFIEIASVTAVGPTGEMTEWERGFMTPPLQRIIGRIPVDAVKKGGIIVDVGALTIGASIYFGRVLKGVKLPSMSNKKKEVGVQEDIAAPVSAPAHQVVDNIKAGDVDGLAVPVPNDITRYMNGTI